MVFKIKTSNDSKPLLKETHKSYNTFETKSNTKRKCDHCKKYEQYTNTTQGKRKQEVPNN